MKNVARVVLSLVLIAVVAMPLTAQEKKGKKKAPQAGAAALVLKRLEKAELTDEQVAKVKELAAAVQEKLNAARAKAELTDEQKAAMKTAREAGKKQDEIDAVAKLTDDQKAALKEAREIQAGLMKEVAALLTAEQKEKAELKIGQQKGGGKKGGGKKKQADTE